MSKKNKTGYKNPPKEHQFTKGKSGNPKGRPKRKNFKAALKDIMNEEVTILVNGKSMKMTTYEATQKKLVSMAANGDKNALKLLHQILKDTGIYQQDIDDFEKYCLRFRDEDIIIIDDEDPEDDD